MKKIILFGEVLIDSYKKYDLIGGAPLHIALNLKKNSILPDIVSSVGKDKNGVKILNFCKNYGLNNKYISINKNLKTGFAKITQTKNENTFKIDKDSAWDMINKIPKFKPDLIYLGSIVGRSKYNIEKLKIILRKPIKYIYFDLNLRKPHINYSFIKFMIEKKVTHLKLTNNEYRYIRIKSDNTYNIKNLFKINKKLQMIAITSGGHGSKLFLRNGIELNYQFVKRKKTINTVGAGDVFSSYIIIGLIKNQNIIEIFYNALHKSFSSVSKVRCF